MNLRWDSLYLRATGLAPHRPLQSVLRQRCQCQR